MSLDTGGESAGHRDMEPDWLSTGDIAERVGYTVRWVERQIANGRLVAIAYDGGARRTFRVRREDFARFWLEYFHDARTEPPG
jgi:excisionase family DNA binding protein